MVKQQTPTWLVSRFAQYVRIVKVNWIHASDDLKTFLNNQKVTSIEEILKATLWATDPTGKSSKKFFFQIGDSIEEMSPNLAEEFRNIRHKILTNNYRHNGQHLVLKYLRKGRLSYAQRLKVQAVSLFCFLIKEVKKVLRNLMPALCIENFKTKEKRQRKKNKQFWHEREIFHLPWKYYSRACVA